MGENISREELIKKILENENLDELNEVNEELIHKLLNEKISRNINEKHNDSLTLGQRTADKIAAFGGSWTFIISFGAILLIWVVLNAVILSKRAFDPYPFVFLNLILSCLAAIQAPIIMMSQNRAAEKDRLTANNDYHVNLKSELIVEDLHSKLDIMMERQEQIIKRLKELERDSEKKTTGYP